MDQGRRQTIIAVASGVSIALLPGATFAAKKQEKRKPTVAIYVKQMHCGSCAKRIAASLYKLPGVVQVATSVTKNVAFVTTQANKKPNAKQLWEAAIEAKLQPVKLVVEKKVYTKHPTIKKAVASK